MPLTIQISPSNKNIGISLGRSTRPHIRQVKRGEHKYKKQENFGSFSLSCYNVLVSKRTHFQVDTVSAILCFLLGSPLMLVFILISLVKTTPLIENRFSIGFKRENRDLKDRSACRTGDRRQARGASHARREGLDSVAPRACLRSPEKRRKTTAVLHAG